MRGARFDADCDRHVADQRSVKSCGESNRCEENGSSSGVGNSVESFTPPVIGGYLQPRDGAGLVHELRSLFLERHSRHEIVHSFTQRERWIEIQRGACWRRGLRDSTEYCYKDEGDEPK